jgi:LPS sulfotransferase NodH
LLAEALAMTHRAGTPDEFFDPVARNEQHWIDRFRIPEGPDYLDHLIRATRTPNGVFGFKLHFHQMGALHRRLAEPLPEAAARVPTLALLRRRFPDLKFVWLSRRNKVAQAISYYRAAESKVWRSWNDGRTAGGAAAPLPDFDRDKIARFLRMANNQDAGWRQLFSANHIPALVLFYEDFIQSYDATIRDVLTFLGVRANGLVIRPPALRRLADAESEEWERRFRLPPKPAARPVARPLAEPPETGDALAPTLPLTAYDMGSPVKGELVPGGPSRAWMDASPRRFAYRCLPMVIANQWGWLIKTRYRVEATWDGTERTAGLEVMAPGAPSPPASSHFGGGILTFQIGFLFRTPPGYNLLVRGPVNMPKDGIAPLEGIVEADWAEATFTMNWQFTRPRHKVVFEPGDPIAMITPVRRGELERFRPEIVSLATDGELAAKYHAWQVSRGSFNADLRVAGSDARKMGWQKDYMRGRAVGGETAPGHQTALTLGNFEDKR